MTTSTATANFKFLTFPALMRRQPHRLTRDAFVCFYGALLMLTGLAAIIGALAGTQVLDTPDPVLGAPIRDIMLCLGIAQLLAALLCLFTTKRLLALGLAAWLSAVFIAYRIGLWTMIWHHGCGFLVDPLGLSMSATDILFSLSAVLLLSGSITTFWIESRSAEAAATLKMPCPNCGCHIKFGVGRLGRQAACPHCHNTITLRKGEETMKTSCYFCKGHIAFPAHALGQKIICPHCKREITLTETL